MGLDGEYERALKLVNEAKFHLPDVCAAFERFPMYLTDDGFVQQKFAPYFETTIRYLGGLLAAYALKKDTLLLQRAEELAQKLDPVFDTPTGLALFGVNPVT